VSTPPFRYEGYQIDPGRGVLTCRYSVGDSRFSEQVTVPGTDPGRWARQDVDEAARLVFLLAGVSYYKTAAPPVIHLGETAVSDTERAFLRTFYLDGLAEFGYRNGLDLSGLRIEGPARRSPARPAGQAADTQSPEAQSPEARAGRPLVPFGGGIDSIVTVEMIRARAEPALFVVSRPGDRFDAIERPAAVTGLPVIRAEREIDPQLLRSRDLGFLNGHVPVTGIISAIAVLAAVLDGRDAVVMSNEWSASIPTLEVNGAPVNHQYSKSGAFEGAFREVLAGALGPDFAYFSALRPFSELWVARRFAALTQYHDTFRSCNRAFHIDKSVRLDHWCGRCDKCCFIDLILAPFVPATDLERIFGGHEPLDGDDLTDADPASTEAGAGLADKFRSLLGTSPTTKPFECVGEVGECRAAALLAAQRPDRAGTKLLQVLAAELDGLPQLSTPAELLRPLGRHFVPDAYAPDDLLV
jgi:UDP-N-acetyl-alpha-D-muramoyl-L-alanyl-L-glutamate epimerase